MSIKLEIDEKDVVLADPIDDDVHEPQARTHRRRLVFTPRRLFYAGLLGLLFFTHSQKSVLRGSGSGLEGWASKKVGQCPVQPHTIGKGPGMNKPENYTELVIGRLSRAVQIPTVSYDDMGPVDEDPRWKVIGEFGDFLEKEYERVYATLEHSRINTYAQLYTWNPPSSVYNPALKPIVLMAHQDVVPVNPSTEHEWDQAPFGGVIDYEGGWVWGRGAADCKNQLMGILSAVDKLIEDGFEPDRPIILAFGFDEEIGGKRGADHLSAAIEEKYGKDSVAFLVDEGFGGVDETYGRTFASIGMAEKGSLYLVVTVETPGGHSSVPPVHTGIGFLAQAVAHLEAHPFKTQLTHESPYLRYLNCLAEYAPDLPRGLRKAIKSPHRWNQLARNLSKDPQQRAFLGTTQAVDLIKGGVKGNALPERAEATVNYRIDFSSSVKATKDQVANTLKPLAKRLNLEFIAFNETLTESRPIDRFSPRKSRAYAGRLRLEVGNESPPGLEPAPITPSDGGSFQLLGGTIKKVFGEDVIVAPSAMFANTDTRAYWNLTKNLYRFAPTAISEFKNPHTVNERMSIRGHLSTIEFFYQLLQNSHGWKFDVAEYQ